jgi:hypothetical protein
MNARPAQRRIDIRHHYGMAERAVESMFGGFHEPEKIRVVHDAGHVRFGELDAPLDFELERHLRELRIKG